jgi:hypothetical protein
MEVSMAGWADSTGEWAGSMAEGVLHGQDFAADSLTDLGDSVAVSSI